MLSHAGDSIAFLSDTHSEWPFREGARDDLQVYLDATDRTVAELVAAGILADEGLEIFDELEPNIFVRRLRNVWMDS